MTQDTERFEETTTILRVALASALAQSESLKEALSVALQTSDALERRAAVLAETIVLKDALVLALRRSEGLQEALELALARSGGLERQNTTLVETIKAESVTRDEAIERLRHRIEVLEDR